MSSFTSSIVPPHPPLQAFQSELESHQKSVDAVTGAGEQLIDLLNDPSLMRQQLVDLKELWQSVCQQAANKKERLGRALEVRRQKLHAILQTLTYILLLLCNDECRGFSVYRPA